MCQCACVKSSSAQQFIFQRGYEYSKAITEFSRLLQLLFYRVQKTFLKLNRTHNIMQELHIGEQSVPQMAWDSIVMALWEIGLQIAKRLWEKMHNKEYQLYFANGDSRKKEMLRQVYDTDISQRSERLPDWTNTNGFFLIAQWHNVPFQNTNTFVGSVQKACLQF